MWQWATKKIQTASPWPSSMAFIGLFPWVRSHYGALLTCSHYHQRRRCRGIQVLQDAHVWCRLNQIWQYKLTRITDLCPWWYDNRALFLTCGVPRPQYLIRYPFPRTLQVAHTERCINSPSALSIPSKDRFIALGNIAKNKSHRKPMLCCCCCPVWQSQR